MRPKPKVPLREVEVTQELTAKPPNWKSLERAFGRELCQPVRTQLLEATQRYVWFARSEKEAVPLSDVEARLSKLKRAAKSLKRAAGSLQSALCEAFKSSAGSGGTYAKFVFKRHFFNRQLPRKTKPIEFAIELSTSIIVACDTVLKASNSEKNRAWREWVQAITSIAKENKLPTGARKDTHPGPGSSPFLALVRKLQRCVPKEYRHRDHSDQALAQAISRARRDTASK